MKKVITQNIFISLFSKVISFLLFLYIAAILSKNDYGLLIYLNMIIALLPLLQLGSMNGAAILLPKLLKKSSQQAKESFFYSNSISYIIQAISASLLVFILDDLDTKLILIIGINFVLSLYGSNAQTYLNAKHEFEQSNIISAAEKIATPIIMFLIFWNFKKFESIFFGQLIGTTLVFALSLYICPLPKIRFKLSEFLINIRSIYKIGFFVYIIWAIDILFRTSDKWFISEFYNTHELAEYGFTSSLALNIWLVILNFLAPYSQVLYTQVAENEYLAAKQTVEQTNFKVYIFLLLLSAIVLLAYPFVTDLIGKYSDTYHLMVTLVAVSVFLSINNMYIYYMISNNLHFKLLKYQTIILVMNVSLNSIFVFLHADITAYSYSTIFSLGLYFFMVRKCFYKDIDNKIKEYC